MTHAAPQEPPPSEPEWLDADLRERAAAYLDMWERHVSDRARRGPDSAANFGRRPGA